jgi:hypothetical protein
MAQAFGLWICRGPGIDEKVRLNVMETMPHYAHIGIVNAARELSKELDNLTEDDNRSMTLNNSSAKSPDHGNLFDLIIHWKVTGGWSQLLVLFDIAFQSLLFRSTLEVGFARNLS